MKYIIEYKTEKFNMWDKKQLYGVYDNLDIALDELEFFYNVSKKIPVSNFKRIFKLIEKNNNELRIVKEITLKIS